VATTRYCHTDRVGGDTVLTTTYTYHHQQIREGGKGAKVHLKY